MKRKPGCSSTVVFSADAPLFSAFFCCTTSPKLLPHLAALRTLRELDIRTNWKDEELLESWTFESASLDMLRTHGSPSINFLAAVARGCPNLKEVEWGFDRDYYSQKLCDDIRTKLPDSFVAKLHRSIPEVPSFCSSFAHFRLFDRETFRSMRAPRAGKM